MEEYISTVRFEDPMTAKHLLDGAHECGGVLNDALFEIQKFATDDEFKKAKLAVGYLIAYQGDLMWNLLRQYPALDEHGMLGDADKGTE